MHQCRFIIQQHKCVDLQRGAAGPPLQNSNIMSVGTPPPFLAANNFSKLHMKIRILSYRRYTPFPQDQSFHDFQIHLLLVKIFLDESAHSFKNDATCLHIIPSVSNIKLLIHRLQQQKIVSKQKNKYKSDELDSPQC